MCAVAILIGCQGDIEKICDTHKGLWGKKGLTPTLCAKEVEEIKNGCPHWSKFVDCAKKAGSDLSSCRDLCQDITRAKAGEKKMPRP